MQSLFSTFATDHPLAGVAAAGIFHTFNRLQLGLAAIALIGETARRALANRRSRATPLVCFVIATVAAVIVGGWITPHIDELRLQQLTHTPQFARLHGLSMMVYLVEMICLAIVAFVFPAFQTSRSVR